MDLNSYYDSYYNSTNTGFSLFAGVGLVYLIISLAVSVFMIITMWKIFKKAGRNGWESIIPIYNIYVFLEIGGQKGAYVFLLLIPCIGQIIFLIFEIKALMELSRRFGKGTGFGILCFFFPIIGFPILAFSGATYQTVAAEPESSILDVNTTGVPENQEFNYGYENQDTVAMNPVNTDAAPAEVQPEATEPAAPVDEPSQEVQPTPTEPIQEPAEPVTTDAPVQTETPVETPVNQVDRFHTPSALDNKDNNQN